MPVNWNCRTIYEEHAGAGLLLAFPGISSCCACICALPGQLVGVHKTTGWGPRRAAAFAEARALIGAGPVLGLYFVGWHIDDAARHSLPAMRAALGCAGVPTFKYELANHDGGTNFKAPRSLGTSTQNVAVFALHRPHQTPRIGIKRSASVHPAGPVVPPPGPFRFERAGTQTLQLTSDHLHRLYRHIDMEQM